jgi:hypothetical protein
MPISTILESDFMEKQIALAVCAGLAFLLPVGFYCFILAYINRRTRPLMTSGTWDAVGLLFAVAGFFLVTVPMLISAFYARAFIDGTVSIADLALQQWIIWLAYFLLLICGSTLILLSRSQKTLIYNIDPEQFPKVLEQTFANLGLAVTMKKERHILTPITLSEAIESTAVRPSASPLVKDSRHAELEIDSFSSLCHITLHWFNYTPDVRRQIEQELNKNLEATAPLDNPAASWFLNISGIIFGSMMMVMLTFIAWTLFARP